MAKQVDELYLHIDFDGFAPEVAGVADEPVPGGLSGDDGERIIHAVVERFRVRAVTLATFTRANDVDDLTLALRLIDIIGDSVGH